MSTEQGLRDRARRAYEWGRLRAALGTALWVAPMAVVSTLVCGRPEVTAPVAIALSALVTYLLWRGGDLGRGVRPGLLAGLAPLLLPLGTRASGHVCLGGICVLLPTVCVVGGLLSGLLVALAIFRGLPLRLRVMLPAFAVAGLAGSLGCLLMGLAGVTGMAAGMALGAAPLVWVPRPQAR